MRVLVGGVAGGLARRIAETLRDETGVTEVVGLDARLVRPPLPGVTFIRARTAQTEWRPVLTGISAAVWVVGDVQPPFYQDHRAAMRAALDDLRDFLTVAAAYRLNKLVIINDAALYGYQPSGPVRETAPVRGHEADAFARLQARAADLIDAWTRESDRSGVVTQLRPAPVCGLHYHALARFFAVTRPLACRREDRVIQVIDENDLAAAAVLAVCTDLPGVYNVAADDGVPLRVLSTHHAAGNECAILARQLLRAWWGWRWKKQRTPPGWARRLYQGAWLDTRRLRAAGWSPCRDSYETLCVSLDAV